MLDRVFDNWCNEACHLLETASAGEIDTVAEAFVHAGPFFVLNLANGNPIIIETNTIQMEEGRHYRPAAILASVDRWQTHRPGDGSKVPAALAADVRDRLLGILFSQCFDIVDRGIGTRADLNFGCQVALGFRKGPLDLMRDLGEAEVKRIAERFAEERRGFPQPQAPLAAYQDFNRHLLVDRVDGVAVVTIRRPQALNALNEEIAAEMLAVLEALDEEDAVEGFVLTGYGDRAFSAGADIGRFPRLLGDAEAAAQFARDCARVQLFLDRLQKPAVAALNGMALGGGLEIAIRCHELVALRGARLQFPEITLGILPGIGGCVVPYRRWPRAASVFHDMILSARPLGAEEALEAGIVSETAADPGTLLQLAIRRVKELAGSLPTMAAGPVSIPNPEPPAEPAAGNLHLSPEAVAIAAETVRRGADAGSLAEALEIGYRGFGRIACTAAAREGITAFMERRPPVFKR
jgi:enoyl-CoA hydratase/3-hydroxyacyl-CoA dehydrogenase